MPGRVGRPGTEPAHQKKEAPMSILTLSGSPSVQSRSGLVLAHLRTALEAAGERTRHLELRDLPAGPLLAARVDDDAIAAATLDTSASSASSDGGGVRHARFDAALSARLDEGLLRVRDALAHARIEVPLDALDVMPGAFVQRAAAAAVVAQRCTA